MAESSGNDRESNPQFESAVADDAGSEEIDYDNDNYTLYKDRPEWNDVTPIKQTDEPNQVLVIDYTPRFVDCFNYFRAVMLSGEKSERVLELTMEAISLNAANYTVWQYRRDVLLALGVPKLITRDGLSADFEKEFQFSLEAIEENEKNYQVWHHRKILTQWAAGYNQETNTIQLTCPEAINLLTKQELKVTWRLLRKDSKNYHTWQYRQWILSTFKCFDGELSHVEELLSEDVRNNSAWNQRYFVVTNMGNITHEIIERELQYTQTKIKDAPCNESPWSYLSGICQLMPELMTEHAVTFTTVCENLVAENVRTTSPAMLSFLLSAYDKFLANHSVEKNKIYQRCLEICDILISTDKIRTAYWEYIKAKLESKKEQTDNNSTNAS